MTEAEKKAKELVERFDVIMTGDMMCLVTDLGYTSWVSSPECSIKGKEIIHEDVEFGWTKFERRAGGMTEEEARKHFHTLIHRQGWGKYNFDVMNKEGEELRTIL
jgi:hypothetical protein